MICGVKKQKNDEIKKYREIFKKWPRMLDKAPGVIYDVDTVCSKTGTECLKVYR